MQDLRQKRIVVSFLLDSGIYNTFDKIVEAYQLPEGSTYKLLDATDFIIRGQKEVQELPAIVSQILEVPKEISTKIACDIAGHRLLPLLPYLPGVDKAIESWGGKVENYPEFRVEKVEDTPEYKIQQLAEALDLELDPPLMKRFVDLGTKYLIGGRDAAAVSKLYMRPMNIGGLEMTQEQIDKLLKMIDGLKQGKAIAEIVPKKQEGAPEVQNQTLNEKVATQQPASAKPAQAQPPQEQSVSVEPVKITAPKSTEMPQSGVPVAKSTQTTPMAHSAPKPASIKPAPTAVQDQNKEVQEVKDQLEQTATEPVPQAPEPTGSKKAVKSGMIETPLAAQMPTGESAEEQKAIPVFQPQEKIMVQAPGDQVLKIDNQPQEKVEPAQPPPEPSKPKKEALKTVKVKPAEIEQSSKPVKIEKEPVAKTESKESTPKKKAEIQKSESRDLTNSVPVISGSLINDDEKAEIEGFKRKIQDQPSASGDIERRIQAALKPAREISKKNGFKKKEFDAVVNGHLKGIRDPKHTQSYLKDKLKLEGDDLAETMDSLEQARRISQGYADMQMKVPAQKSTKEVEPTDPDPSPKRSPSPPPKAKVQLSKPSTPPKEQEKPTVSDVKFARKLQGPVEEIGTMTTEEFRRLSSDPMAAAQKIIDKVEVMEEESYAMRIEGIKAWRKSAVNRLYLAMMREALEKGVAIAEVASMRRNVGEESLSPTEIKALVFLNSSLKF